MYDSTAFHVTVAILMPIGVINAPYGHDLKVNEDGMSLELCVL